MQRRQPEAQTNLAEKIGLASRYYIKNNMVCLLFAICLYYEFFSSFFFLVKLQASDQLITEDAKTELVKESQVHLLDLNPMETAAQIMVCLLFCWLFRGRSHMTSLLFSGFLKFFLHSAFFGAALRSKKKKFKKRFIWGKECGFLKLHFFCILLYCATE